MIKPIISAVNYSRKNIADFSVEKYSTNSIEGKF